MNCKHLKVAGNTTKYFYCNAKEKAINNFECNNCLLKISDNNTIIEFLKGFKNEKYNAR